MLSKLTHQEALVLSQSFPKVDTSRFQVVARCKNASKWSPPAITVKKASNYGVIRNFLLPFAIPYMGSTEDEPRVLELVVDETNVFLVDGSEPSMVDMAENLLLEAQACDPLDPKDYAKRFTRWANGSFSFSAARDAIAACSPALSTETCDSVADEMTTDESEVRHSPPMRCNGAKALLENTLEGSLFEWWFRAAEYWDLNVCDSFQKSLALAAKRIRTQNFVPRLFGFSTEDDDGGEQDWVQLDNDEQDTEEEDEEEDFFFFAVDENWLAASRQNSDDTLPQHKHELKDILLIQTLMDGDEITESREAFHVSRGRLRGNTTSCFAQALYPVQIYDRPVF